MPSDENIVSAVRISPKKLLFMETFLIFAVFIIILKEMKFDVVFMDAANDFIRSLPEKVQKKVVYNINRVRNGEMDKELFAKLGDSDIWEFRTLFNGIKYRLLAFWDTEQQTLVVACNGFVKKTQKTPLKEIDRAKTLKKLYFNEKYN